jgi:hypothetical protein
MPDQCFTITQEILQRLSELRCKSKFNKENLYPGAPTEKVRMSAEQAVNAMIDRLVIGLRKSPRKSYVLSEFLEMLKAFEYDDTEEREQACTYCERVMEILGIESSDGLLNTWLYGFDPDIRQ